MRKTSRGLSPCEVFILETDSIISLVAWSIPDRKIYEQIEYVPLVLESVCLQSLLLFVVRYQICKNLSNQSNIQEAIK